MRTASDLIIGGELNLYGAVMDDENAVWMWEGDVYFTPQMVRQALVLLGEGRITVRLNSGGGSPIAGEAIRAMLAAHPGGVTAVVEGMAASAASLLFMGATRREVTQGSFLMIHDPSGGIWGTEAQMRAEADRMALIAAVYAQVYAAASGRTAEEARQVMLSETWIGAADAVAEGWADAVADDAAASPEDRSGRAMLAPPTSMENARDLFRSGVAGLVARRARFQPAMIATTEEAAMANGFTPAAAPTAPTPVMAAPPPVQLQAPAPAAPVAPVMAATPDPVLAERQRIRAIRDMAAPFMASGRLTDADVSALIDDGTAADVAGSRLMVRMAAAEPAGTARAPAAIVRDEVDTRREGMIGALMRRTDGPAEAYRGMTMRRLAMELAGPRRGYNDIEAVRHGMRSVTMMGGAHGVSDFAYITTEVMNRSLIAEYTRRPATWQAVCGRPLTATDFRELYSVRGGGDFQLKPVLANGEYTQAVLQDQAEGLKVERRGRTLRLTFEAVVNDDMGFFDRIPAEFALAARTMESSMVWAIFRANPALKSDSVALFHATHGNLAGAGGAISAATVAAGRKAMWEQKPYGSKDADDFLQVTPDRLITPPALELAALQFVSGITPATTATVNPYASSLTQITVPNLGVVAGAGGSETAWYLVSSDLPPIRHAYLEGYEAPTVQTVEGMNPDVVVMDARHIFGAAAHEFRGAYKNPGA